MVLPQVAFEKNVSMKLKCSFRNGKGNGSNDDPVGMVGPRFSRNLLFYSEL